MFEIRRVENKQDWKTFVELQFRLYKKDPYFVPQLRVAVLDQLNVQKNPFFRHATMNPLLIYKDGRCVGRIVGVVDENYNRFHDEKIAFFGYFECENDPQLARLLLDETARWARERGMKTLRGPVNLSTNNECGLLVEGFDSPPQVMMTYNPSYYAELIEKSGFSKARDLYAYELVENKSRFSERIMAQAERLKQTSQITLRTVKMENFDEEIERILKVYNTAWERNWGFVPMEEVEFRHMAKDLKMIIDPRLVYIVEKEGKPVGFSLALPDVNQVFKKIRDGRLLPFGLPKLLWHLKGPGRKRTITRCRIVTLGIIPELQSQALGPLMYTEYIKRGPEMGYSSGEASWILENNTQMNRALVLMGARRYKTYRIYDRPLS